MKLLRIPFLLLVFSFLTFAQPQKDTTVSDSYQSGLEKIKSIMLDGQEGIPADYEQNPDDYAQTRNLDQDLNIDEMVKFFGCATSMCETYLKEALLHPFSKQGKERMLQRQRIIRALVENPELKAKVDELIAQAKEKEAGVVKLLSEKFKGETSGTGLKDLAEAKGTMWESLANFLIKNETYNTLTTAGQLIITTSFLAGNTALFAAIPWYPESTAALLMTGITSLIITIPCSYGSYKDYSHGSEKRSAIHAVHALISLLEEFESLSAEYNVVLEHSIKDGKKAKEQEALMNEIKRSRYKHRHSYIFKYPAVHTFAYSLYEKEKHLAKVFAAIGELDALNAIATKMIEHKDKDNSFCFSEIIESEKPIIEAEDFWNVQVPNPVVNSIVMDKNIILTGPNAGGKSTAMRALLQDAAFAQFGGFAAGKKFKATFFDIIHSYLNISDDLKKEESFAKAEINCAQQVRAVERLLENTNKKFLYVFDELFIGMPVKDGEMTAYEYFKKLFQSKRALGICASHFDKTKALESEKDSNCINYKIDPAVEDQEGNLKYPYTLSKGINTQGVGFSMAKKAGLFD